VDVHYLPVANFITRKYVWPIRLRRLQTAAISADGSEAQFTYVWDFGDGITSTQKNPQHKFTAVGIYPIDLK